MERRRAGRAPRPRARASTTPRSDDGRDDPPRRAGREPDQPARSGRSGFGITLFRATPRMLDALLRTTAPADHGRIVVTDDAGRAGAGAPRRARRRRTAGRRARAAPGDGGDPRDRARGEARLLLRQHAPGPHAARGRRRLARQPAEPRRHGRDQRPRGSRPPRRRSPTATIRARAPPDRTREVSVHASSTTSEPRIDARGPAAPVRRRRRTHVVDLRLVVGRARRPARSWPAPTCRSRCRRSGSARRRSIGSLRDRGRIRVPRATRRTTPTSRSIRLRSSRRRRERPRPRSGSVSAAGRRSRSATGTSRCRGPRPSGRSGSRSSSTTSTATSIPARARSRRSSPTASSGIPTKFPKGEDIKIDMNHPLRLDGWRLFQSRFGGDGRTTILQVNRDPGLVITYPGVRRRAARAHRRLLHEEDAAAQAAGARDAGRAAGRATSPGRSARSPRSGSDRSCSASTPATHERLGLPLSGVAAFVFGVTLLIAAPDHGRLDLRPSDVPPPRGRARERRLPTEASP